MCQDKIKGKADLINKTNFIGMKKKDYIFTVFAHSIIFSTQLPLIEHRMLVEWQLRYTHRTTGGATQQLNAARLST